MPPCSLRFLFGTSFWLLFSLLGLRAEADELRLETVFPRLAGKNQVRWYEFDWRYTDFSPAVSGAAVRLYFYENERKLAEAVQPAIKDAYAEFVDRFQYRPRSRIPFLLYNSHFEFESTQAFLISEQVLGVTSTEDLTMALPYWGEHDRFLDVMRHELAHQFTIQKIYSTAADADADCNPLLRFPLWFIEGIAQYYALPGITPDVRAVLADTVLRHEEEGKEADLPSFFDEGPYSFERIYLMGHAAAQFLQERYGTGTIRRILEGAPRLCKGGYFYSAEAVSKRFAALVADVAGHTPEEIETEWQGWTWGLNRNVSNREHELADLEVWDNLGKGEIDSFSLSPDGSVLFYRLFDFETGEARLYLRHVDDPDSRHEVTADRRLGLETLHPFGRRITALDDKNIVYIGRSGRADRAHLLEYELRRTQNGGYRFRTRSKTTIRLGDYDHLLEGGYPALDTDGSLLLSGLNGKTGFLNVYRFPHSREEAPRQLTNDIYTERDLTIDTHGTVFLSSNATPAGNYEIMRLGSEKKESLTALPLGMNCTAPTATRHGLAFQCDATGYLQAYTLKDRAVVRLTDVPTFFQAPAFDAQGNLFGLMLLNGRRRLVRLPARHLLSIPLESEKDTPGADSSNSDGASVAGAASMHAEPPKARSSSPHSTALEENTGGRSGEELPSPVTDGTQPSRDGFWTLRYESLNDVQKYNPYDLRNYQLLGLRGAAATGPFAVADAVFGDRFKSRIAGISALYSGNVDVGEFTVFYLDRSRRTAYGGSLFLNTGLQFAPPLKTLENTYLLQRLGGSFDIDYPFGRYMSLSGSLAPQRLRAFRFSENHSPFAAETRFSGFATEGRLRFGIDTLRHSIFGPVAGASLLLTGRGTFVFGNADPFGAATIDFHYYRPLISGYNRIVAMLRLAAGSNFGGRFREQYYLPAAYNLRTIPEGSRELFGDHYALTQLELAFPLSPLIFDSIYLQGILGADAGGLAFTTDETWENRAAAGVLGANLGIGPILLRFHFARAWNIGGRVPDRSWNSYISVWLAPGLFGF